MPFVLKREWGASDKSADRNVENPGKPLRHSLADRAAVVLKIADKRLGDADFLSQFLLGHTAVFPVDAQVRARRHITLHIAIDIGLEKVDGPLIRILPGESKLAAELRLQAG